MDLTVYGRQEEWEDSPDGWPTRGHASRTEGLPHNGPRLQAGHSDDLGR